MTLLATDGLTAGQWFSCIGIALISIPLGASIRLIPLPKSLTEYGPLGAQTASSGNLLQEEGPTELP